VEGDSLSAVRRAQAATGQPFPRRMALTILAHAAAGLHAAHELCDDDGTLLHVVHRDVSPQNIMLGATGEVKVIDFGIAKARRRMVATTREGDIKGKVQYMAPEQVGRAEVDRRTDVWGIGAVLYHLLAGQPPYAGHDELGTLRLLLELRKPPRIEGLAAALEAILDRTLAPDPADRFATAEELSHALEEAARDEGGLATPRELGRFVESLIGARLSQRRVALKSVPEAPEPAAPRQDEPQTAPTEPVPSDDSTGARSAHTLPAVYRTREAARARNRRFAMLAGGGLVAIVAASIALAAFRTDGEPPDEAISPASQDVTAPEQATTALPPEPAIADARARDREQQAIEPDASTEIANEISTAQRRPSSGRKSPPPPPRPPPPPKQPSFSDLFKTPK